MAGEITDQQFIDAGTDATNLALIVNGDSTQTAIALRTGGTTGSIRAQVVGAIASALPSVRGFYATMLTFTGPGATTQRITHNLNSASPTVSANVTTGSRTWQAVPFDNNHIDITMFGPSSAVFTLTGGLVSVAVSTIDQGLLAKWMMQDGPASFADSSPFANTLTGHNVTAGAVPGLGTMAAIFNGATAYASGTNDTATNLDGTTPFSIGLWATFDSSSNNDSLVSSLNPANNYQGLELQRGSAGNLIFLLSNNSSSNIIALVSTGTYGVISSAAYIVVTYDGSKTGAGVNMYMNAAAVPATIAANTLTGSSAPGVPITIGARSDVTQPHNGGLGFVRIYNRVLSPSDISNYYALGAV